MISKRTALFFGLTFISTITLLSILASNAFTWVEDPVLKETGQVVRAPHVTELRESINDLRTSKGLSAYTWTNDPIVPGSTPIRIVHFIEMQSALLEIYEGPWLAARPVFATIDATRPISLSDLNELRISAETVGWLGDGECQTTVETCANSVDCQTSPCTNWSLFNNTCGADCPNGLACGSGLRCYRRYCGQPTRCTPEYSCQRNTPEVTYCNCRNFTCSMYENATECWVDCGCGNNMINTGEQCDLFQLNGQSCASQSFSGGSLSCTGSCTFNTTNCYSCGNLSCETAKGENGSNCPYDCCDANTTCGSQGRTDGYNYCTGDISSPQDGSAMGYTFVPDATISAFCNSAAEAYTSSYTCNGTTYRCCNPQAGTIAGKWSTAACGCNNNGVRDGDETGVDCGGTHCGACQVCNNGTIEGTEVCDGSSLGGNTCVSEGYSGGTLSCTSGCELDTSSCFLCGNTTCESGEDCDNCAQDCDRPISSQGVGQCGVDGCPNNMRLIETTYRCSGPVIAGCTMDPACHDCGNTVCDGVDTCDTCSKDCNWLVGYVPIGGCGTSGCAADRKPAQEDRVCSGVSSDYTCQWFPDCP